MTGDAAPATPPDVGPVLVVGCGLIGTSIGLAATRAGLSVHLSDTQQEHAAIAESLGAGTTDPPREVGLVVVAVPPDHVADTTIAALQTWPEAVVTDVSSVKVTPLAGITASGAGIERYVGGHPMAGSEQSGPMAASAALFEGRVWAVTPHERALPASTEAVRRLAEACGATVRTMLPAEHDAAVARVSHLPHLLSVLAAGQLNGSPPEHLALAGQGLRDVTRVAAGDPVLWRQIIGSNAGEIAGLLQAVRADIDVLLDGLEASGAAEDTGLVERVLVRGASGTTLIPGKHGGPEPETETVYVQIPDAPGELARLFSDTEESGVNIEDVRIDHELGRRVGVAELGVLAMRADELLAALTERGWTAYR